MRSGIYDMFKRGKCPDPKRDDEKPFAFWLVRKYSCRMMRYLKTEGTSNRQFYIGLAVGLAIVAAAGMMIRGCIV